MERDHVVYHSLGWGMDGSMTFDDEVKLLGPRPQPRPGGSTWRADREWFGRYLELFPKDGPDMTRKYQARKAKGATP